MSVSQAEYNAFKMELQASSAQMGAGIEALKKFAEDTNTESAAVKAALKQLQESYSTISLQAAPWSAAIQAEVAASEAKATSAVSDVRALYDITKAKVEDLRRRAAEAEKKNGEKHWGLTRAKDLVPDVFSGKEDGWAKFKDSLIDYAESCHDGLKTQLKFVLNRSRR